ncbi:hypothetical protein KP509_15G074700 [Ceratopteris richardii]|nr:hypothetical protein KP509_15G074700 [Ceratopteris richardii]
MFKRGQKHLLSGIHRRKICHQPPAPHIVATSNQLTISTLPASKAPPSPCNSSDEQAISSVSSPMAHHQQHMTACGRRNPDELERLKKENAILVSELASMRRLCSDLLLFIQNNVDDKQQDFNSVEGLAHFLRSASDSCLFETIFAVHTLRSLKEGGDMVTCRPNKQKEGRADKERESETEERGHEESMRVSCECEREDNSCSCNEEVAEHAVSLRAGGTVTGGKNSRCSSFSEKKQAMSSPFEAEHEFCHGGQRSPTLFGVTLHRRSDKLLKFEAEWCLDGKASSPGNSE